MTINRMMFIYNDSNCLSIQDVIIIYRVKEQMENITCIHNLKVKERKYIFEIECQSQQKLDQFR